MADRVGQQLGNYRVIRLIGSGGFAEVYLGEHIYLKTQVAIKLLRSTVANEADLEGFLTEARTIAHLVHPHIVRVMDFGVDAETPFLVMDYAANGTLRQRHPKATRLPLTTIVPYVQHIATALQHAHDQKLIHRDVKPENMLLGRNNDVLLSDFGIALIAQSSRYQSTQDVIGTVAYMSPEQIQGKPRPASDQYSLGVVVYEWLCGERPFTGSFTELCTQHMFAPPPPLQEKFPTILPEVEQVVTIALAKDPKQRFLSVQAFANALEQASQAAELPTFVKPLPLALPPPPVQQVIAPPPPAPGAYGVAVPPPAQAMLSPYVQARHSSSGGTPVGARPVTGPSGGNVGVAEGRNVWRIGKREVVAMIVGAILCGGLATIGYFLTISPSRSAFADIVAGVLYALAIGAFFFSGPVFGPWVGLFVGGMGLFIVSAFTGALRFGEFWYFDIGFAIAGFIGGLALLSTKGHYNTFRAIATAVGFTIIGSWVVGSIGWILSGSLSYYLSNGPVVLLFSAFGAAIPSLILLPIMLVVYNRIVGRRQRV